MRLADRVRATLLVPAIPVIALLAFEAARPSIDRLPRHEFELVYLTVDPPPPPPPGSPYDHVVYACP